MEEISEDYCHDHVNHLSFARGGPIFTSYHLGPLTSVPDFKASLLLELQDLEAELVAADDLDVELSVDELRIFTEVELVDKAFKEEFEHERRDESLQILEHANIDSTRIMNQPCMPGREIVCFRNLADESNTVESGLLNDSSVVVCVNDASEKKIEQKRSKKRGRLFDRNTRASELESSYFEKVKQLAKILRRQDEDKFAARLHSFSGNVKPVDGAITASDKINELGSLRFIIPSVKMKTQNLQECVPLRYPEVVLYIEIYCKRGIWRKNQEFLVLGSQYLTELKDNIYCLTDTLMQTDGKHDTSGYFLIEDTFCNYTRNPSAFDYSKPILDWLQNCRNEAAEKWEFIMSGELKKKQKELLGNLHISNLPNFKAVDMHKIRFCDLRFRLGASYLYCHQGNCNHTIVIRDMRLIHLDDSQNSSDYPLLTYHVRPRQRKCSVCQIYPAVKMTVDDKWAQENPCYFCIKCYFLLHYKEDNSLLYPHTVYDYFHE